PGPRHLRFGAALRQAGQGPAEGDRLRLPALRPPGVAWGAQEHPAPGGDARHGQGPRRPPGRRAHRAHRSHGLREGAPARALRWHAAARRAVPGTAPRAAGAADGRALRGAGRAHPRADEPGDEPHLAGDRDHHRARHPLGGRGGVPGQPDRRHDPAPGQDRRGHRAGPARRPGLRAHHVRPTVRRGLRAGARPARGQSGARLTMAEAIGVGIIGLGGIGTIHARALADLSERTRLVAYSGGGPDAAAAAGWPDAVPVSARDVVGHDRVGVVAICSPTETHASLALAELEAGRHVVVEKPLAVTVADAEAVARLAEERGLMVSMVSQRRFEPEHLHLKRLLDAGELGELRLAATEVHWYRDDAYYASAPWRTSMAGGGGSLMNQGVHNDD